MINSFTAIDFETAHPKRWSICQVGLVRVENLKIVKEISILVQPPDNYYWGKFTGIHGITPRDTENEPTFDKAWCVIEPYIKGQHVVAHNGFGFDFPCLNHTLEYYNIEVPEYFKYCTYKIYREGLASLCRKYVIKLHHHDALSDSRACAELFKMYIEDSLGHL
jgi:DNA polymerase-3 subunit epsilon